MRHRPEWRLLWVALGVGLWLALLLAGWGPVWVAYVPLLTGLLAAGALALLAKQPPQPLEGGAGGVDEDPRGRSDDEG
jgi:hypothetical protein